MNELAKQDLFSKITKNTPNAALLRSTMEAVFAVGTEAAYARREIHADMSISGTERRNRLDEIATGHFSDRLDALMKPLQPMRTALDEAGKARPAHSSYISPEVSAATDAISIADAALYFAKRDLEGR